MINKVIEYLNNTINHLNLMCSMLHPTSAEHTFFSNTYGIQWEINERQGKQVSNFKIMKSYRICSLSITDLN